MLLIWNGTPDTVKLWKFITTYLEAYYARRKKKFWKITGFHNTCKISMLVRDSKQLGLSCFVTGKLVLLRHQVMSKRRYPHAAVFFLLPTHLWRRGTKDSFVLALQTHDKGTVFQRCVYESPLLGFCDSLLSRNRWIMTAAVPLPTLPLPWSRDEVPKGLGYATKT